MSEYLTTLADEQRLKDIWKVCFGDTDEFIDWFFKTRYAPQRTLGIRENGVLLSDVQMIPYEMNIRGISQPSWWIVGAATMPEARRKGHMAKLLKAAYEVMRENGINISHLYPFHYDFYRKFGYDVCSKRILYRVEPKGFLGSVGFTGLSEHFPEIRALNLVDEVSLLTKCYAQCMRAFDGYVVRSEYAFKLRLEELAMEGVQGICCDGESGGGYAIYLIKDDEIVIVDSIYDDPASLFAMLAWLGKEYEGISRIEFTAPATDDSFMFMEDGRKIATIEPYSMLRIIDAKRFIESLRYPAGEEASFVFDISGDADAPWNNGILRVELSEGRASCTAAPKAEPDFRLDILALAQLLSGEAGALKLYGQHRLICADRSKAERLNSLIPALNTFIIEMY